MNGGRRSGGRDLDREASDEGRELLVGGESAVKQGDTSLRMDLYTVEEKLTCDLSSIRRSALSFEDATSLENTTHRSPALANECDTDWRSVPSRSAQLCPEAIMVRDLTENFEE